jgi:hypothetical protein
VKPKLIRLVLAAVLFAAWMGYLVYLVHLVPRSPNNHDWLSMLLRPERPNDLPIVLSRPQILVSQVDVVGTVNVQDRTVQVKEVLYYPPNADKPEKDSTIQVENLHEVKDEAKHPLPEQANLGLCLLPLETHNDGKTYQVVHVPSSPGYSRGDARIYPATEETLAEYRHILEAKRRLGE